MRDFIVGRAPTIRGRIPDQRAIISLFDTTFSKLKTSLTASMSLFLEASLNRGIRSPFRYTPVITNEVLVFGTNVIRSLTTTESSW